MTKTVALGSVAVAFYLISRSVRSEISGVRELSESDPLTKLHNISHFRRVSAQKSRRAKLNARPLALLMMDLDDFKKYSDTDGHEAGSVALNSVADALRDTVRSDDLVAQYGG